MPLLSKKRHEKRKSKRINLSTHASIRRGDFIFSGEIINVSDTGAYVATNAPYAIGDLVELTITFGHEASILSAIIPCKVARIDGRGVGLISSHIEAHLLSRLELMFDINKNDSRLLVVEFCKAI